MRRQNPPRASVVLDPEVGRAREKLYANLKPAPDDSSETVLAKLALGFGLRSTCASSEDFEFQLHISKEEAEQVYTEMQRLEKELGILE